MEIDLKKKYLKEIQAIIQHHAPDCRIRVFGSRATGKSGKFSDLDLAIEGSKELDLRTMVKMKNAFRESNLPFKVDVLDWLAISGDFREQINQECITIQGNSKND